MTFTHYTTVCQFCFTGQIFYSFSMSGRVQNSEPLGIVGESQSNSVKEGNNKLYLTNNADIDSMCTVSTVSKVWYVCYR